MFTAAKLVCHRAVSQIPKYVPTFQNVSSQTQKHEHNTCCQSHSHVHPHGIVFYNIKSFHFIFSSLFCSILPILSSIQSDKWWPDHLLMLFLGSVLQVVWTLDIVLGSETKCFAARVRLKVNWQWLHSKWGLNLPVALQWNCINSHL